MVAEFTSTSQTSDFKESTTQTVVTSHGANPSAFSLITDRYLTFWHNYDVAARI